MPLVVYWLKYNCISQKNGLPLSKSSFNRTVLHDLQWCPYKIHVRHQLLETDLPRRRQFAEWLLHKPVRFIENIVIGDEAFFMSEEVNTHSVRKYAPRYEPPEFNFSKSICREKLSLWIEICWHGSLVGPIFYDNNLNGGAYLNMIIEILIPELHRIYGNRFNILWWFQDRVFGNRVVSLHHDVEWPPWPTDLTLCDFYLCEQIKSKVTLRHWKTLIIYKRELSGQ